MMQDKAKEAAIPKWTSNVIATPQELRYRVHEQPESDLHLCVYSPTDDGVY